MCAVEAVEEVDAADLSEDVAVVVQDVDADFVGVATAYAACEAAASDAELVMDNLPPLLA